MKKLLLSLMFVAVSLMVTAQTQLSENQTNEVIASLTILRRARQDALGIHYALRFCTGCQR